MQRMRYRNVFRNVSVVAGLLCLGPAVAHGQEVGMPALSSESAPTTAGEVRTLSELIRDLQAQVQVLNSQLGDLRAEQQRASEEARALRQELDLAKAQMNTAPNGSNPNSISSAIASNAQPASQTSAPDPQESTAADRIAKLEEDQEITDSRLNEQNQTKVESGSKYRLRLSGMALLNLYENRGLVDNQDFPEIAEPSQEAPFFVSPGSFGGSLRQSQIKLEAFGPDLFGARTSANVDVDFAGGFANVWNGAVQGLVRLRTATMRLDWANTSVVAGQDTLFFAPLAPTSLATLAAPPLAYAGNLWSWTPQVRVEHRFLLSDASNVELQAGILDSLTGDMPAEPGEVPSTNRNPSWGEESGQPGYATRISWNHRLFGENIALGAGGYFGRQDWGLNRNVNGWAATTDVTIPFGKQFELTGEFYRGRAVAGLGGGIGQSVLLNGSFISPATTFLGLDSMGGWAQLKYKLRTNFEINAALGLDNPFASEMRLYMANSIYDDLYTRNLSPLGNFIYQIRSDILFSFEYRRIQTSVLDSGSNSANIFSLSLGYIF